MFYVAAFLFQKGPPCHLLNVVTVLRVVIRLPMLWLAQDEMGINDSVLKEKYRH